LDFDRDRAQTETIGRTASPCAYHCTIVSDPRRLTRLRRAWTALYRAGEAPYLSDSFEWAWLSWNLVSAPRGRRLSCAVVWRRSRIDGILPIVASRRGVWRLARPLTSESTEYCPFLVRPSAPAGEVFESVLSALQDAGIDVLRFNWVRDDGALGRWLATRSGAVRTLTLPSTEVRFRAFGEWKRYRAQLAHRARTHLHRARQRATKLGALALVEVTEPAERAAVWRWMLHHKRRWLAQRKLQSHWLATPEYERFMLKSLEVCGPERMRIFSLRLNGVLIAADLCNDDGARLEQFFNVFDDSYSHIGPGNLLREYCTEWAFARGLDYDLRPGRQPYKQEWASEVSAVSDYTVPLNWLGRRFLVSMRAYDLLARRIPRAWLRSRVGFGDAIPRIVGATSKPRHSAN
jgi:CelD/BcsL family acetyltransferase involved in cellulose biosynthesis